MGPAGDQLLPQLSFLMQLHRWNFICRLSNKKVYIFSLVSCYLFVLLIPILQGPRVKNTRIALPGTRPVPGVRAQYVKVVITGIYGTVGPALKYIGIETIVGRKKCTY